MKNGVKQMTAFALNTFALHCLAQIVTSYSALVSIQVYISYTRGRKLMTKGEMKGGQKLFKWGNVSLTIIIIYLMNWFSSVNGMRHTDLDCLDRFSALLVV